MAWMQYLRVYTLCRLAGLPFAVLSLARASAAEYYGYDQGGSRFAALDQITPGNVGELIPAWTYHTGDLARRAPDVLKRSKFEVTPILVGDKLVACTPFNAVVALDPGTGRELWRYDPQIKTDYRPANMFNCRGVALWRDANGAAGACAEQILTATADLRLMSLDLKDGKPCADFGQDGAVHIDPGKPLLWPGEFQFTSPPAVIGDLVILGSSIGDNARVDAPRGTVRAFDVRTGALRWAWDPVPDRADDPDAASWGDGWRTTGPPMSGLRSRSTRRAVSSSYRPPARAPISTAACAPATIAAPIPSSPSRPTPARSSGASSSSTTMSGITTIRPSQASPPSPSTARRATSSSRARSRGSSSCSIATPASPSCRSRSAPSRRAASMVRRCRRCSPSRPICRRSAPTASRRVRPGGSLHGIAAHAPRRSPRRAARAAYPPSLQGTLVMPFTGGGVNWGGLAVDGGKGVVYVNSSNLLHRVTLFLAADYAEMKQRFPDEEVSPQRGAPYGMKRELLVSPLGLPCNPPPYGVLTALDLGSRKILWQVPLGTTEELNPLGLARNIGTPTFGGPLATASGLIFIGAALDDYLRAFDAKTGAELWTGRLPSAGIATPTSYLWQGRHMS